MLTLTSLIHRAQKTACKYTLNDAPILLCSSTIRSDAKPAKNAVSKFCHLLRGLSLASTLVLGCTMALADDYVIAVDVDGVRHYAGMDGTLYPGDASYYKVIDFTTFSPSLIWSLEDYSTNNQKSFSYGDRGLFMKTYNRTRVRLAYFGGRFNATIPTYKSSNLWRSDADGRIISDENLYFCRLAEEIGTGWWMASTSTTNAARAYKVDHFSESVDDSFIPAELRATNSITIPSTIGIFFLDRYYFDGKYHYSTDNGITYTESLSEPSVYETCNISYTVSGPGLSSITDDGAGNITFSNDSGSDTKITISITVTPQNTTYHQFSFQREVQLYTAKPLAPAISITGSGDVTIIHRANNIITSDIFFTIDGSTPTTSSTQYSGGFTVTSPTTIKAIAVNSSVESDITTEQFISSDYVLVHVDNSGNRHYIGSAIGNTVYNPSSVLCYKALDLTLIDQSCVWSARSYSTGSAFGTPMVVTSYNKFNFVQQINGQDVYLSKNSNTSNPYIFIDYTNPPKATWYSEQGKLKYNTTEYTQYLTHGSNSPTYGNWLTGTSTPNITIYQIEQKTAEQDFDFTASLSSPEINSVGSYATITANATGTYTPDYYFYNGKYHYNGIDAYDMETDTSPTSSSTFSYSYSKEGEGANYVNLSGTGGTCTITCTTMPDHDVYLTVIASSSPDGYSNAAKSKRFDMVIKSDIPTAPSILADKDGNVTISAVGADHIYYTTDGSTPTSASAEYTTALTGVANGRVVKAVASRSGILSDTAVATVRNTTGHTGQTVILDDLEDHNWTYYKGLDEIIDGVSYKTKYAGTNPLARIYSPNPRNVKITYIGNGIYADDNSAASGVQVSSTETENSFVYYETLDRYDKGTGTTDYYKYLVIPNPFTQRPSRFFGGIKQYYGCRKWYVESVTGGIIKDTDGNTVSVGGFIMGDTDVKLIPADIDGTGYTENCISMQIVLKAYWEQADRVIIEGANAIDYSSLKKDHRELNFLVLRRNVSSTVSNGNVPVTVMMAEPDGSADYRTNNVFINGISQGNGNLKIENSFISIQKLIIGSHDLILGRGISNNGNINTNCINAVQGINGTVDSPRLRVRVESGVYPAFTLMAGNVGVEGCGDGSRYTGTPFTYYTFGSDYDRAINNNSSLKISHICYGNNMAQSMVPANTLISEYYFRSGTFSYSTSVGSAEASSSCYFGVANSGQSAMCGHRFIDIIGGDFMSLAGGIQYNINANNITYRIHGGMIHGSIYGSAADSEARGINTIVITGGEVAGWIAGGCNGLAASGGITNGSSQLYIGGNAYVGDRNGNKTKINHAYPGSVFGAGSGNLGGYDVGKMTDGTNVVIADNAHIEESVYGGGYSGYTLKTANVIIAGGTIDKNVFGGSNQNKSAAEYANVLMVGGLVKGGVYGGSNELGSLSQNTNVTIKGGTVGTSGADGYVCGGGLGTNTVVKGDINVVIGIKPTGADLSSNKDSISNLTIYGEVYGGSALGYTNVTPTASAGVVSASTPSNKSTTVKMYSGTVIGDLYGGALGSVSKPATIGAINQTIDIYGGKVTGGVYGGSNINASMTATPRPRQGVTIHNTWTPTTAGQYAIGSVFGGGNGETAANSGQPGAHDIHADGTFVTVDSGYIENVFGGGNAAKVVKGTVDINTCGAVIGSVYGGCNAADVTNNATTTIWGGTIGDAFAGGNGVAYVDDSNPGTSANVGGNALLTIHGGTIKRAFAGSNNQGTITGNMDVVIDQQANGTNAQCTETIDEVYGGGNLAAGKAGTITIDCTAGTIGDLYGGANQADITGDIALTINKGTIGRVFGGNNTSGNIAGSITVNIDKDSGCDNFSVGNVYGGGNLASYAAPTSGTYAGLYPAVNILAGTVTQDVFGGGLGTSAVVSGNPTVVINGGTVSRDVYGGGSQASVTGNTAVTLTSGTVAGNIYGGGLGQLDDPSTADVDESIAANVSGTTTVTVDDGQAANVFGCNNLYGAPSAATVNINGGTVSSNVYGGGNLAAAGTASAPVSPVVTVTGGTMTNVYGGGLGETAVVTGNPTVSINKPSTSSLSVQNIFGGGDQAITTGNTTINLATTSGKDAPITGNVYGGGNLAEVQGNTTINAAGGSATKIFGGGNGDAANSKAANITGNTTVLLTGTAISGGLYGGCNAMGTVNGNTSLSLTGGSVGTSALAAEGVFGGGYGQQTGVNGNVDVALNGTSVYGDVYGGSALGSVNSGTDDYTHVTLTSGTVNGNIYGGGLGNNTTGSEVSALVKGTVEVAVNGGSATNVFGCNNKYGAPQSTVAVNVTDGSITGNVYGGGNLAAASVSPTVAVNGGTINNVYGGGLGATAIITGNPTVTINKTATLMTVDDVFGGGDAASVTGNPVIYLTAGQIANAFGGGNQAGITGSTTVNQTGATVSGGIYGGCNSSGTVSTNATVSLTGGSVTGNVHGGGYGKDTDVDGLSTVSLNGTSATVAKDIYGGSALGAVTGTAVTIKNGTVSGSVYGGGLGQVASGDAIAAVVNGNVQVTVDGGQILGSVYGCNNANGSPLSTSKVQVDINATPSYTLAAVYGGGNVANSDVTPILNINDCDVNIGSVYGGGNAASTKGTNATIWGGTIGSAFGGGNGTVSAANVDGNSSLTIHGGTITSVYAGSNTQGVISGTMGLNIDHVGKNGTDTCTQKIGEIYGGGNKAPGKGAVITIGCGTGYLGNVYGGSRAAKINGNLTLNIEGGQIDNVFGGNNESGEITGNITVNIKTGDCKDAVIKNVYGGGNLAAFNNNTTVNLISGKVGTLASDGVTVLGGNVFGGGYGESAVVTGNTTVNLCSDSAKPDSLFRVLGSIYGGGDLAPVEGNTTLNLTKGTTKYAFGGGNKADVTGNTKVTLNGTNVTVSSDIYGGGSLASVSGGTDVELISGTVSGNVYGGGLGQVASGDAVQAVAANVGTSKVELKGATVNNVFGSNNVNGAPQTAATVTVSSGTVTGNVYGGGNLAAAGTESAPVSPAVTVTGGTMNKVYGGGLGQTAVITGNPTVTINKAASSTMSVTDVFGGGDAASVTGNPVIYLTAGQIANAFGGGNQAGITGSTTVNQQGASVSGGIYGGCNSSGTVSTNATVSLTGGSVTGNVHGGGYGKDTDVDGLSTVSLDGSSATVSKDIYGGSALGSVTGTAVTITDGSVSGSVYGGGLGDADNAAAVNGNVQVTVDGGKIDGNVYGCNNVNGAPVSGSTVNVDINATGSNTIPAVFGGGNMASYEGTPHVSVNSSNALVGQVFGGGNAANVSGTDVTIWGGTVGDAFAGGNGVVASGSGDPGVSANVNGNALLTIHGGTITRAFAGSNNQGSITGSQSVTVDNTAKSGGTLYAESVKELYGGGNLAAGKAGTISIDCTANNIDDVYGGANQADITGNIVLNITEGQMKRVFGGNNTSGDIAGSITVNINKDAGCNDFHVDNVYGGGNLAPYSAPAATPNYPAVNILAGTVTKDVFGGGLGTSAIVTGTPTVIINGGTVSRDVYGGGSQASVTGNTAVTLTSGTVTGNIYGGGLGSNTSGSEIAANVSGTTTVSVTGGTAANVFGCNNLYGAPVTAATVSVTGGSVTSNVYGGGNLAATSVSPAVTISGGTISGNVFGGGNEASIGGSTVSVSGGTVTTGVYGGCNTTGTASGDAVLYVTGGTVGTVFGGGYGQPTVVSGNVDVNIGTISGSTLTGNAAVTGDVYGGSALGTVGTSGVTTNHVNVTLNAGSVGGSIYGGGLGRKADSGASPAITAIEAKVYSPVQVTMNGGTINGDIFGCNNLNGAPESTVQVDINGTAAHVASPLTYAVRAVYGGGNEAAYAGTPAVNINNCDASIGSVYGGGNAAATGGTNATIWGGIIGNAFGGGNGESGTAADVNGNSRLNLYGGTITNAFAGSNMHGEIKGTMKLQIGGATVTSPCDCDLKVTNTYGGGNQAASQGAEITIGCGAGYLGNVYGGAKAAAISGGLTLNIEGGQIDNVFGGNDVSGDINGDITVNIKTGGCTDAWIKNVYGGGNMAAFTHNTTVNLISGTVGKYDTDGVTLLGGNVFGGGYGNTATVTGNTTVNLCSDSSSPTTLFSVLGSIYGGGDLAPVTGNTTLNLTKGTTAYAFGGGNKAVVTGDTKVKLEGADAADVTVSSDIYGGGSLASVSGGTYVELIKGTVSGSVYGGGLGQASGDATPAIAANVGTSKVELKGATVNNIFGCNNVNGAPQTSAAVTVASGEVTGNVYGGGNLAAASLSPSVSLTGGTVTGDVFGAGLGASAVITGDPTVTVNGGTVSSDVYGGGSQASVTGNTSVTMTTGSVGGNIYGGGLGKTAVGDSIAANVSGTATVNVNGGTVTGSVFGCNNLLGAPAGSATVTVDMASGSVGGNVYGGGNQAAYTGDATVYLTKGTVAKAFGGGYGATAIVKGNPTVNFTGATVDDVFGGGDEASLEGDPQLSISGGKATQIFGGGNKALVTGNPAVSVTGGTHGTIFGGGNEANVTGTPTVTVKGDSTRITGNVFGGGNQGNVSGSPTVTIGE